MGIKTIMQAKKILVVASGEDKAQIVKEAFWTYYTICSCISSAAA